MKHEYNSVYYCIKTLNGADPTDVLRTQHNTVQSARDSIDAYNTICMLQACDAEQFGIYHTIIHDEFDGPDIANVKGILTKRDAITMLVEVYPEAAVRVVTR